MEGFQDTAHEAHSSKTRACVHIQAFYSNSKRTKKMKIVSSKCSRSLEYLCGI